MITDRQILWKRKHLWLFSSVFQNGSIAANNPLTEINWNTTGRKLQGTLWDGTGTTGFTSSQSLYGCIPVPQDCNPQFAVGFKFKFIPAVSASSTNSICWSMGTRLLIEGTDTLNMSSFTATDPNFTSQAFFGRGILHTTNRTILDPNWASRDQVIAGLFMEFEAKLTVLTGYNLSTTNKLWLLGLMMDYVPMKTRFPHSETDCPVDDAM